GVVVMPLVSLARNRKAEVVHPPVKRVLGQRPCERTYRKKDEHGWRTHASLNGVPRQEKREQGAINDVRRPVVRFRFRHGQQPRDPVRHGRALGLGKPSWRRERQKRPNSSPEKCTIALRAASGISSRPSSCHRRAYCPRRPDLADVDWGFMTGTRGAGRAGLAESIWLKGCLCGRLGAKSGIPRGDFFFMGRWGVKE